ncbi:MAG: hypothetical protein A3K10_15155 [Bacteroidetes bacterium RIFCSPLOWO2_12_FULL_31_6]|nr:MAG: hypothetical protein A3K10_15155 [Bacteroidetes bacterium RIFCSPLOWO2_12_FULL_31_6]
MSEILISINPFAEFLEATPSRQKNIIREQLNPDPVRVPYYQLARATMRKSILNNVNISIIQEAINELNTRTPERGNWRYHDKVNSITALEKFKTMLLPSHLVENKLEAVKTKVKYLPIYGVNIKVSPNLIFRTTINGQKVIGAFKIHTSKGKPFGHQQSALVAQLINQFLSTYVAEEDEFVDPQLCFCIDVFAGTTINSSSKIGYNMKQIIDVCKQIPKLWDDASMSDAA